MMLKNFSPLLKEALSAKVASSISLCIGLKGETFYFHEGSTFINPLVKTNDSSIYDVASLTKIMATTIAIAQGIDAGDFSLEDKPFALWPKVTFKNILEHKAGFIAHKKFYLDEKIASFKNFNETQNYIYEQVFLQTPGDPTAERVYSDLGFIALAYFLQQRYKKPLIDIFNQTFALFEASCLYFASKKNHYPHDYKHVAPTGFCPLRNEVIRAQVHDLNCYYLGGLSAHAGVFANLKDVSKAAKFFLKAYQKPKNSLEHLLKYFMQNKIGFDHPAKNGSITGLSPAAFGHFGFTGTSLWCDPARDLYVVLLTNRVHMSEEKEPIFWLRKKVHDLLH